MQERRRYPPDGRGSTVGGTEIAAKLSTLTAIGKPVGSPSLASFPSGCEMALYAQKFVPAVPECMRGSSMEKGLSVGLLPFSWETTSFPK